MIRKLVFAAAALLAAGANVIADERPALEPGNYFLYYAFNYASPEQALCILQVEKKGGDLRATILEKAQGLPIDLSSFKVDGRKVDIAFDLAGRKLTFEGTVNADDRKLAIGSFGDDRLLSRAKLLGTEKDKLGGDELVIKVDVPEAIVKAVQLAQTVSRLQFQLQMSKVDADRDELKKKLELAENNAAKESPALLKQVIEKNPESPSALQATVMLLGMAEKIAKPDEAEKWVKEAERRAAQFGPRFEIDFLTRCADALKSQKGFWSVSKVVADDAAKLMTADTPLATKIHINKALLASLKLAGKTDLAAPVEAMLGKMETELDKQYLATVPPFKPKAFAGRKQPSERVAVMELFTGAQCPPCVAADVAFDALLKSYKPTDLVLIQYHLHIPGPDPLSNADSEARWKYYGDKFKSLRGTPSVLFNGKASPGGGGGMTGAEAKYKEYREIIDPLLEETSPIKIIGDVSSKSSKINVKVQVTGIEELKDAPKLRFLLVEETIKYVGGNGLRFHHHVVRDMPGGMAGFPLGEMSTTKNVEIDLEVLRKKLTKYLDDYSKENEFYSEDRPLELKNLRVIALVQDDKSGEILQARQMDVPSAQ